MRKHLLKDLDKIIETATRTAFSDLLGPLLEDERKKQDDMAARTKDLDAGDAAEIDEAEEDEEGAEDKKAAAVAAATGKKPEEEEAEVTRLVKEADTVNERIDYEDLPFAFLNIYINSEIKGGSFLDDPEKSFRGFINWYSQRAQKKINNLK